MNKYIEYLGTEAEYTDGTRELFQDEDTLNMQIYEKDGYTSLRVKSLFDKRVRKLKIRLGIKEDISKKSIYVNEGFKSGLKKVCEVKEEYISRDFFSVIDENGVGISFMTVIPAKFNSEIRFSNGEISLETVFPYSYRGEIITEEFLVSEKIPYSEAFLYNAEKGALDKEWEDVTGWGSWDYYFTSIDEEAVKENVDFIYNDDFLKDKIKYIAIDDGWQQREGDWEEGVRFRSGLSNIVSYIKEKGYSAGIWTAPTRLHGLCATVMRRNSFLVKDALGDPITDETFYVADPTHPEGEKYIREIYTYLKECGFNYYKIDFISNMLQCDYFYDENAGHYDALRKLISIIRECVGEDSHIMGCSLPYAFGGDGIDSRRVGLDIHNTWKHIKKCTEIYLPQFASHRKIYQNDFDYLVVRGSDTSFEKDTNVLNPLIGKYKNEQTDEFRWRDGEDFSYNEAKFWCATILMSGSSVILSDRMTALNEKGLYLIKKTLEYADFKCAVPDVCSAELPTVWRKDGWIYIFNYSEEERTFSVTAEGKYSEIFDECSYEAQDGLLKVCLSPHTALVLKKNK